MPGTPSSTRIKLLALLFEAGLTPLAIVLGLLASALLGWDFWGSLMGMVQSPVEGVLRGIAVTIPLLILLSLLVRSKWEPLRRLRRQTQAFVRMILGGAAAWELALLAALAGIGEELLFRGVLQPLAIRWTSPAIGVIVVSLLFGALHAHSRAYFLLATAISVYFGWVAWQWNDLVAPMIAHGLYDFVALQILLQPRRASTLLGEGEHEQTPGY